jgi:molybdopterin converting factor small subunit
VGIRVRIPPCLRQVIDTSTVEIEAQSLGEAIEKLEDLFPGIKRELTDQDGRLLSLAFDFYINGKSSYPSSPTMLLNRDDEIIIIPLGIEVGG